MSDASPSTRHPHIHKWLQGRSLTDWRAQFDEDGYIIIDNVMSTEEISAVREALCPYLEQDITGRNDFEGLKSNRVYALLAKSPVFAEMVTHPLALAFAEADLGQSCLLSACLAINLQPGETVQPWHHDDSHMAAPMPRPSWGVSAFWAIDAMTRTNGATEVLPGSHRWGGNDVMALNPTISGEKNVFEDRKIRDVHDDPAKHPKAVKATMPAGSLMLTKGTLLHRGGANQSDAPRLIVTPQYCVGWARQLENMMAAIPPQIAATLPRRAQELIGYSIHPPFMGYVDGVHPSKKLSS